MFQAILIFAKERKRALEIQSDSSCETRLKESESNEKIESNEKGKGWMKLPITEDPKA
jgi:hypothetical protein